MSAINQICGQETQEAIAVLQSQVAYRTQFGWEIKQPGLCIGLTMCYIGFIVPSSLFVDKNVRPSKKVILPRENNC